MASWAGLVLVCALFGPPPLAAQQTAEAPLNISADNMSGTHGPEGDEVLLNGDVTVTRGRTVVTANKGRYQRTQGMLFLEGDVTLEDSTTTITCEHASYSEEADVIDLSGDVTMVDGDATLSAPAATYDRRKGVAELYGGVHGANGKQTLRCDRAIYTRATRLLQTRGNSRGEDVANKLTLEAAAIDYDRVTHEAEATGRPTLTMSDEDDHAAVIHAVKLRVNTETRVAQAIDSVHVVRDTLQASADYGLFDDRANRGWLLGHPRAWDEENTVTGDTLELWSHERQLERVVVRGNAAIAFEGKRPDNIGENNRLEGRRVDVYFKHRDIDSLVAVGDARNEYRGAPRKGRTPEANTARGDTITVFFAKREIDRALVQGNANGEYLLSAEQRDTVQADSVRYDATRISYLVSKSMIELDGKAHLVFRDLELTAKRVEFDVDGQTLVASGDPELVDRGDKVTGHIMTYDLETRVGNIYQAETSYEKGLYHGQQIRKVSEGELDIMNGAYSTCDLANPHYHFSAHWMKIYLRDKLVAKPVVFYVKNVPLLALPFWIFPIKPGRHSGFLFPQFELGFTNRAGQFLRNAGYYWAINDFLDLTLSGDYYNFEPSWVVRAEFLYKQLYVLDGNARASFARNDRTKSEDWDLYAEHQHELGPRTRLSARGNFVSSKDYNSSNLYGRSLAQRLNRFMRSSLAFTHQASWASFNAALDRTEDLDAEDELGDPDGSGPLQGPKPGTFASLPSLSQTLPTISVSFPTRSLGSMPLLKGTPWEKAFGSLYFDLDARFASQYTRTGFISGYDYFVEDSTLDSIVVISDNVITRRGFAVNSSLSDSRRAFGWLNLRPSISGSGVVFDFDEIGNKVVPVGTWSSALTASTTFYGTFRTHIGSLQGVRHILFPTLSLAYSPRFESLIYTDSLGRPHERFRGFSGIGVSGFEQFRMNFGLDQRIQAKLVKGDQVTKLDNLFSWAMVGSYNFLYKEQNQPHPLSSLSSNVLIQPPGAFNALVGWVTDVYSPRPLQSLSYNLNLSLSADQFKRKTASKLPLENRSSVLLEEATSSEQWDVTLAYSYSGGYPGPNHWQSSRTANAVVHYQLTPAWSFDYAVSYDVTLRDITAQRYSISRDLHCWTATFTRTFAPEGEQEYYFRLGVKDQKELYIERGTRSGSFGGIN